MESNDKPVVSSAADIIRGWKLRSPESTPTCKRCSKSDNTVWNALCDSCQKLADAERAQKYAEGRAMRALGGLRAYRDFTFEKFHRSAGNSAALETSLAFDPGKDNLYICGPVGTGKSHLSIAAARKFVTMRRENSTWNGDDSYVAVLRMSDLSRLVRGADGAIHEKEVISEYANAPVLILDDLGAEKPTEFLVSLLYEIVDKRYMDCRNGLIVTSNRTLDQLAEKLNDDRVPSRLAQLCKVLSLIKEKDHRIAS